MPTTFNAIFLGNIATQIDPTENNYVAENADQLVGQTFGSAADPLFTHIVSVTANDLGGGSGYLNQNQSESSDTITVDLGSGPVTNVYDAVAVYNTTVTYADGSTATVSAIVMQDTVGNLFLAPEVTDNADTAAYEAMAIRSLTLTSLVADETAGLSTDRDLTGFDNGIVDGTDGDDVIDVNYVEPAASGSDRVDNNDAVLPGTSGNDDYIDAQAGSDIVFAGDGNDSVEGGDGYDVIDGGAGDDTLRGGFDEDTLIGGAGADALFGNDGRDMADYSASSAAVNVDLSNGTGTGGDAEGDTLTGIEDVTGSAQSDTLTGDQIFNVLNAGAGDDTVLAGGGGDTVIGGLGDDSLDGEAGADMIIGDDNSIFLAEDPDALIWTPPSGVTFSYASGTNLGDGASGGLQHRADVADTQVSDLSVFLPDGDLDITAGDTIGFSFTDENGQTIMVRSATVQQTAFSTGADDTGVVTAQGVDQFGNEIALLLSLTDNAGSPNHPIAPGDTYFDTDSEPAAGADVSLSSTQTVSAFSGAGNDTLIGGGGVDTLLAGAGDDWLEGGAGADIIDGGDGRDWASYESSGAGVTVSLDVAQSNNQTGGIAAAGGHANGDTLSGIENLDGSDFDDILEGDSDANEITGGAGNDVLYGVLGDDTLEGEAGNDTIDGGVGNDVIFAGDGDDSVVGGQGTGADLITGNAGADTLEGGRGDDTLIGGTGDDVLRGGRDDDLLFGGDGDDVFDYRNINGTPSGTDTISDFGLGNSGSIDDGDQTNNDFVDLSNFYNETTLDSVNNADADPDNDFKTALKMMRADQQDGVLDGIINGIDYSAQIADINLTIENGGSAVSGDSLTFDTTNVVCFVRGTHIIAQNGETRIQDLRPGDLVLTTDRGFQPIRWIGSRRVPGKGKLAPILISRDALNNHRDLYVSQQHRMLLSGWWSELMFAETEVLTAAKHLVNDSTIRRVEQDEVEYFHMLFDRHEIVFAEGIPSESFHPGEQGWSTLCEEARAEILEIFPELADQAFSGYGPTARPVVKAQAARLVREIGTGGQRNAAPVQHADAVRQLGA